MNPWEVIELIWRPVVEITVLAVVIYYAFNFVRRTKAWPVVLGIFVLLLAFLITTVLDLKVLNSLLRAFTVLLALGSVVLFQPELRRLLAEIGSLSKAASLRDEREHIEVIIESAERLAEVRIGALLAIEQHFQLDDVVESGVVVDAKATPEMLETIFFPNNAVHDGGVTIRKGRIIKAACIFPLTQRQDLNKSMGTRHRAAIGLSEETDAVIVVISEETGAVSYAYKGELQKGVTSKELRAFLSSIFVRPSATRTMIQNLSERLKRISVFLARPINRNP